MINDINFIKRKFDILETGPQLGNNTPTYTVPQGRPLIVCGASWSGCAGKVHDDLLRLGYDTYASKEGLLGYTKSSKPET